MNTKYDFYPWFFYQAFDAWYKCLLSKYEGVQVDRDSLLAYIGGGEL